jgi:predicted transcriptional regulator
MTTFTSTLPDDLLSFLSETARLHSMPKNKIIERALRIYLDQLKRAEYVKSYKKAAKDEDVLAMAEEGMEDYLKQLQE